MKEQRALHKLHNDQLLQTRIDECSANNAYVTQSMIDALILGLITFIKQLSIMTRFHIYNTTDSLVCILCTYQHTIYVEGWPKHDFLSLSRVQSVRSIVGAVKAKQVQKERCP